VGFRFQKRIPLGHFLRVNLSKGGGSLSVGVRGLRATFGRRGTRLTAGLPGSGLSYSTSLSSAPRTGCFPAGSCVSPLHTTPCVLPACNPAAERVGRWVVPALLVALAVLALYWVLHLAGAFR
jgi:hypothetical protein